MTQLPINILLTQFQTRYTTRIGYPANQYVGECLSLVKYWVDTVVGRTCAPASGNGYGDGYYSDFPAPLPNYFDKVNYGSGNNYPAGSLVIYARTHHIAIWLKDNGNGTHTVFEQNADPDGSAPHIGTRANTLITGILSIKVSQPAVVVQPQGDNDVIQPNDVNLIRIISSEVKGWPFNDVQAGKYDAQELKYWSGRQIRDYIQDAWNSSQNWRGIRGTALNYYNNSRPAIESQLSSLQTTTTQLNQTITALQTTDAGDTKTIQDLQAQLASLTNRATILAQPLKVKATTTSPLPSSNSSWLLRFLNAFSSKK